MRGLKLAAITGLILVIAFIAYKSIYVRQQSDLQTTLGSVHNQEHVVIFLIKSTPTNFFLVPVNRQVGSPVNPAIALQTLLNGPLAHEDLHESVPHTTKLIGLSIHDGLAIANFSSELVDDFNGGALIESYLVEAIVSTLTEFPEIKRVQILVDGEQIESIGGHVLITGPLTRDN